MSGGTIRIASANFCDGGVSPDGTTARSDQTVTALRDWQPRLVLVQELYAPGGELRKHFRALASASGMEPAPSGCSPDPNACVPGSSPTSACSRFSMTARCVWVEALPDMGPARIPLAHHHHRRRVPAVVDAQRDRPRLYPGRDSRMNHHDAIRTGSHGGTAAMPPAAVPHAADIESVSLALGTFRGKACHGLSRW